MSRKRPKFYLPGEAAELLLQSDEDETDLCSNLDDNEELDNDTRLKVVEEVMQKIIFDVVNEVVSESQKHCRENKRKLDSQDFLIPEKIQKLKTVSEEFKVLEEFKVKPVNVKVKKMRSYYYSPFKSYYSPFKSKSRRFYSPSKSLKSPKSSKSPKWLNSPMDEFWKSPAPDKKEDLPSLPTKPRKNLFSHGTLPKVLGFV